MLLQLTPSRFFGAAREQLKRSLERYVDYDDYMQYRGLLRLDDCPSGNKRLSGSGILSLKGIGNSAQDLAKGPSRLEIESREVQCGTM